MDKPMGQKDGDRNPQTNTGFQKLPGKMIFLLKG